VCAELSGQMMVGVGKLSRLGIGEQKFLAGSNSTAIANLKREEETTTSNSEHTNLCQQVSNIERKMINSDSSTTLNECRINKSEVCTDK
jgi:hypothetical protein